MTTKPSMLFRFLRGICSTSAQTGGTIFIIFSIIGIMLSNNSIALSKLDLARSSSSIAPENLRRAADSFRISLGAEDHTIELTNISETKAWQQLEYELGGYADRLELQRTQSARLQRFVSLAGLAGAIMMLLGSVLGKRLFKEEDVKPMANFDGSGWTRSNPSVESSPRE